MSLICLMLGGSLSETSCFSCSPFKVTLPFFLNQPILYIDCIYTLDSLYSTIMTTEALLFERQIFDVEVASRGCWSKLSNRK